MISCKNKGIFKNGDNIFWATEDFGGHGGRTGWTSGFGEGCRPGRIWYCSAPKLFDPVSCLLFCYLPIPNPRCNNPTIEYKKGGPSEFVSKLLGTPDRILINFVVGPNNKNLLRLSKGPFLHMPYHIFLRFSDTIDYLFKDGGCWKTHGCYASMMLSPGFSILFKKKGIYHRPMQSIWRGHCGTNNGWTV